MPTLAAVDAFGSRRVAASDIVATAGLPIGTAMAMGSPELRAAVDAATAKLKARYSFAFVAASPISYFGSSPEAGKMFITIDVVDADDTARMQFAPPPTADVPDPAGLVAAWLDYERVVWPLAQSGAYRPPYTCRGGMHCALGFNHPELRDREDRFIEQVPGHVAELARVLHEDRDAERRAAAAFALAYGADRAEVVAALIPAIDDPSSEVRNNALRVLIMIQQKAGPDEILVPLGAAIRAMRFPKTTDRNKAAYLLVEIAKHVAAADRARIVRELGDELVAMAAMQQPNNRDPAIDILRTVSGEDHGRDAAAWRAWLAGQRRH